MARSLPTGQGVFDLPQPVDMKPFWGSVFPILAYLSDQIENRDAYWRRIQRILAYITSDGDFPCPFNQKQKFINSVNYICSTYLKKHSYVQILKCLEVLPQITDSNIFIWQISDSHNSSTFFLDLLDQLVRCQHRIWTEFIASLSNSELMIDRLLPFIEPLPCKSKALPQRLIAIQVLESIFTKRRPENSYLLDTFLNKLYQLISRDGAVELRIHCFRVIRSFLETCKSYFGTESYTNHWNKFVETSCKVPYLRHLIECSVAASQYCSCSLAHLSRAIFQNNPDPQDIWQMTNILVSRRESEKPLSAVQYVLTTAATNEIFSRVCCKAAPIIIRSLDGRLTWVQQFIRKATGFVVISNARNEYRGRAMLVLDLFVALSKSDIDLIRQEVSNAAAVLLASQRVPMAIANALKPSMRLDTAALAQWTSEKATSIDLRTMLTANIDEKSPRPPTGKPAVQHRRSQHTMVVPRPPTGKALIGRGKNPAIHIIKTNRLVRAV